MTGRYLGRRLLQSVLVLWASYTVSFIVLYLLPGNPVDIMLSGGQPGGISTATPEQVAQVRHEFGFDKPVLVQYLTDLGHAVTGRFGTSLQTQQSVVHSIVDALPPTIELTAFAMVLAIVFGVGLAVLATYLRSRKLQELLLALPPVGISLPTFWIGLILIEVVSFRWGLLPAVGSEGFKTLILPGITLAIPSGAVFAQVMAKSLVTTLAQPYIEVVRAKGASRLRTHVSHALRNASLPTLTLIGVWVGGLISGSVVVEVVFSRNGLGQLTAQSVSTKDIPMIQGIVVLIALVYVVVNLVVDLLYPLFDPRISHARPALAAS